MQEELRSRERRRTVWKSSAAPLLTVLALAAIFFLSYFNRFAGLRSGDGEFSGGMALLAGHLPYRDYYTAGPPLNQIKSAIELLLFGKMLIVSRAAAVVERLGMAALLYQWLRRSFSPQASMLASMVAIVVSAGDRSDPLASYNHDAILFAMVCGFAASVSLRAAGLRNMMYWAATAGAGAGLSTLTKQTVGLGTAVIVLAVGTAAGLCGSILAIGLWLPSFFMGFLVPVACVALWLRHLGVLHAAVRMLFVSGPSAKATHPWAFFERAAYIGWDNLVWVSLGLIAFALSARAVWRGLANPPGERGLPPQGLVVRAALLSVLGLFGACEVLSRAGLPAVWNFSKSAVYFTIFGVTIFGLALLYRALRRRQDYRTWELALFAAVSWSVAFTLSLSWPAFEAMTMPGLGLLIAATWEGVRRTRWLVSFLLAVLLTFQLREKLDLPFTFGYQDEPPIRFATAASGLPALRGMRLPPETVRAIDGSVRTAQAFTVCNETLFTYPEMGLLNTLANRAVPTLAGSHNIDVVPDWFAREEAQRLLKSRPAVIAYAAPTEDQLEAEESLWRNGHRSGQRDLVGVLNQLTRTYLLTDSFQLRAEDNPIRLYVRPDVGRPGSPDVGTANPQSCR